MAPIWKLLRSKKSDDTWNTGHRAALRSAFANRQWTQARCYTAKFVGHNRCLLCLDDVVKERLPHLTADERAKVEPTGDDIARAPVGNLFHRIAVCPRVRNNCAITRPNLEKIFQIDPIGPGDVRIERGLFSWDSNLCRNLTPKEPFTGSCNPPPRSLKGTVYPDGSWLDGPGPLARGGWAFVVTDILGEVLAIARGLPPNWVTDIPGCEAWAVLQAAALAQPGGVTFNSDCQPCIKACKGSLKSEASAKKKHARIYNVLSADARGSRSRRTHVDASPHIEQASRGVA